MHEKKKCAALVFFSLIVVVLIAEGSLRFAGWGLHYLQDRQNRESTSSEGLQLNLVDGKEFVILCIGESTTAMGGMNSWPRQLQRILNSIQDQKIFHVVNRGIPGIATTSLSTKLPKFLSDHNPDLVLAMVGINDYCGFDRSLDCEELPGAESTPGESSSSGIQRGDLMSQFRIYGLIEWIYGGITARVSGRNVAVSTAELLEQSAAEGNSVVYNLINPNVSQLHPRTIRNLNYMVNLTTDQGIDFAFVQYAVRKTDVLRNVIEKDVIYISNYEIFWDLLKKHDYSDLFVDNFATDFGHATAFGNRVIADNVARQLLKLFDFQVQSN